ncbi:MAG TPA: thioesterase [Cytophagales bacterium]|nr:thioesterase [Cytophagales bacterium]HAA18842.1 thioesterase [Cytophagales bacterium]HAP60881.1 thioesterase [Cytophagales bacterium]
MARIRIDFPPQILFSVQLSVRITDLNYGAHVGNDTFLRYLQEARTQLLRSWGYPSETEGIEGVGLIVADVAMSYRAEVFYGDELLVEIAVQDIARSGFDWVYRLSRVGEGTLVALAKTGMVCFDYEQRKVVSIPDAFKAKLSPER